jgi:hypothetical protein
MVVTSQNSGADHELVNEAAAMVARHFGISASAMRRPGPSRHRDAAMALAWVLQRGLDLPLFNIADEVGGDNRTALSLIDEARRRQKREPWVKELLGAFVTQIHEIDDLIADRDARRRLMTQEAA